MIMSSYNYDDVDILMTVISSNNNNNRINILMTIRACRHIKNE